MNTTEALAELATLKAHLAILNAAISALADPTVKQYRNDTGQTVVVVERHELPTIFATAASLRSQICELENRLGGTGVVTGVPGW